MDHKIELTGLLQSLGIGSANPIADAYLVCSNASADSVLSIDRDAGGPLLKRSLILVKNVPCSALTNPANFTF